MKRETKYFKERAPRLQREKVLKKGMELNHHLLHIYPHLQNHNHPLPQLPLHKHLHNFQRDMVKLLC